MFTLIVKRGSLKQSIIEKVKGFHPNLYENNNLINIAGMSFSVIYNEETPDKKLIQQRVILR